MENDRFDYIQNISCVLGIDIDKSLSVCRNGKRNSEYNRNNVVVIKGGFISMFGLLNTYNIRKLKKNFSILKGINLKRKPLKNGIYFENSEELHNEVRRLFDIKEVTNEG